jgi:hypothetical protein
MVLGIPLRRSRKDVYLFVYRQHRHYRASKSGFGGGRCGGQRCHDGNSAARQAWAETKLSSSVAGQPEHPIP